MARKKVDTVQELRITLGDYERRELKQTLDGMQINSYVNTAKNAIVPIGIAGIVGVVGYLGVKAYAAAKTIWNDNPLETVEETVKEIGRTPFDWIRKATGIDLTPEFLEETIEYDPSNPGPGKYYWPPTNQYLFPMTWVQQLSNWQQTNTEPLPEGVTQETALEILQIVQSGLGNLPF